MTEPDPIAADKAQNEPAEPGASTPASSPSGPPANATAEAGASAGESQPAAESVDWKTEAAKLKDQLLRLAADFDNFRKRARRESEDATRRGRESAIKDLLPVFDNLERATTHSEGAADVKAVVEGLRMVGKQFESTLDRMGVRRVTTIGQAFDPTMHEAIQHVESAEHPAGVVLHEVQAGYMIGDHLLRAAMVVVSKGPGPSADSN